MQHVKRVRLLFSLLMALIVLVGLVAGATTYFRNVFPAHAASGSQIARNYLTSKRLHTTHLGKATKGVQFQCQLPTQPIRCYSPQQIQTAYDIQRLYGKGYTGKGQTIAIFDFTQSPTIAQDLHTFDTIFGLPDPKLNIIAPFGLDNSTDAADEITLDVEWAHAIAPDATINLVLGTTKGAQTYSDLYAAFLKTTKYAIDNNLGNVLSESYGFAEPCLSPQLLQESDAIYKEAAAKHISVFGSSADQGVSAPTCDFTSFFTTPVVNYPATDPYVTGVGGTYLDTTLSGKYLGETTWSEVAFDPSTGNNNGATGGGISKVYLAPSYQKGVAGIGSRRGVPDVAYNADPRSGVLIVCSSCGAGPNAIGSVGGTSAGAPQWAGIVALGNQIAGRNLGFINPAIYSIGKSDNYARAFHDIVIGNNSYTFLDPTTKKVVTVLGYSAHKGWDNTTGWGTPIVSTLLPLLIKADNASDASAVQ